MNEPDDDDPLVRLALEGTDQIPDSGAVAPTGLESSQGSANLIDTLEVGEIVAAVVDLLTP